MTQLEQIITTIKDWERDIRFPNDDREAVRKDTLCEVLDYLTAYHLSPEGLDEAAVNAAQVDMCDRQIMEDSDEHRMLYSRHF